jgi:hypothetical protein
MVETVFSFWLLVLSRGQAPPGQFGRWRPNLFAFAAVFF